MDLRLDRKMQASAIVAIWATLAVCGWVASAAAGIPRSHGQLLHVTTPGLHANATQSSNWFGYNQGTMEQGGKQFHAITGQWTVPRARQRAKGRAEASSTWIGIGGGCVNASCTSGDSTLIQAGTEQDVNAAGKASYSAWYELIPAPSITIGSMVVRPGDRMRASVAETLAGAEVWKITLRNVTRGKTFTTTLPYTSTHATAEWIEETPLAIGTNPGLTPLPDLSRTTFDAATVNGAPARLKTSERIVLAKGKAKPIGTPSAPDSARTGFRLCAWETTCPAPRR